MAGVESVRLEGDEAAEIMEKGDHESLGGHSRGMGALADFGAEEGQDLTCALKGSPDTVLRTASRVAKVETGSQGKSPNSKSGM